MDKVNSNWVGVFNNNIFLEQFIERGLDKLNRKNRPKINKGAHMEVLLLVLNTYTNSDGAGEYMLFTGIAGVDPNILELKTYTMIGNVAHVVAVHRPFSKAIKLHVTKKGTNIRKFNPELHCQVSIVRSTPINNGIDLIEYNPDMCFLGTLVHREAIPPIW